MATALTDFLEALIPLTWPRRLALAVVLVGAFAACWFLSHGFAQWWPGCENFNTALQQAGNAERAQRVAAGCPSVSAADVLVALAADTAFPVCYAILGAGIALLIGSSAKWGDKGRRFAARMSSLFLAAGALDMLVENLAIFVVALRGWPPALDSANDYLLMTAALMSWAKVTLILVGLAGCVCLAVGWPFLGVKRPRS